MSEADEKTGAAATAGATPPAKAPGDEKITGAAVRNNFNALKNKIGEKATNAAAAVQNKIGEDDSDEESSSDDDEIEDLFSSPTRDGSTAVDSSTAPAHSAITIRNQPPPKFIVIEEEKEIQTQRKEAKALRKKLKKIKKLSKAALKSTQQAAAGTDALITYLNAVSSDNSCTDASIAKMAADAEAAVHAFRDSTAFVDYSTRVSDVMEQIPPLRDHAKLVGQYGKARSTARDRRAKMETGQLDVGAEAQYNKAMDIVKDFDDKDQAYKDEFKSLQEHNSSQIGQTLKTYLLETATFLEAFAATLRKAAGGEESQPWFLSDDCRKKYANYQPDPNLVGTGAAGGDAPSLFSPNNRRRSTDDRLLVKPNAKKQQQDAVAGIPVADEEQSNPYGTSKYTQMDTRGRRDVDSFLQNGRVASSNRREDFVETLEDEYGLSAWGLAPSSVKGRASTRKDDLEHSLTPDNDSILPALPASSYRGSTSSFMLS